MEPQPPLCLSSNLSVLEVAKKMAETRADAAILLDSYGQLEGIVSDNDVARCCTVLYCSGGGFAIALDCIEYWAIICFVFCANLR